MTTTSVRHTPGFGWLWAATGISALGTFVGLLAMGFTLVDVLDASPAAMGLIPLASITAGGLASPLIGVLVDRLRRRPMMIAGDIARAVAFAVVPIAHRGGFLSIPLMAGVALVAGVGNSVFNVAYQSHLPRLVGRERVVDANTTIGFTVSLAEIAGFGVAGVLVGWLGAPNVVVLDACSFVASALCLLAIRVPEPARDGAGSGRRRRRFDRAEVTAGFGYIRHQPVLRSLVGAGVVYDASEAMSGVAYLIYVRDRVGFAERVLTPIFAIGGVVSLAGAWVARRAERTSRTGLVMVGAGLMRTVGVAATPLATAPNGAGVGLLAAAQIVTDPAWALQEVAEVSIRQGHSPDEVAGRIAAARQSAGSAARVTGILTAMAIGATAGPRTTLWVALAVCAGASVLLAISPIRRLRSSVEAS